MLHYLWWIPILFLYYAVYSWLSLRNNELSEFTIWYKCKTFWLLFAWGALCPIWLIVTRISKNLLFDGILYDVTIFLAYILTMISLGEAKGFLPHQWVGVFLLLIGFLLLRIGPQ